MEKLDSEGMNLSECTVLAFLSLPLFNPLSISSICDWTQCETEAKWNVAIYISKSNAFVDVHVYFVVRNHLAFVNANK